MLSNVLVAQEFLPDYNSKLDSLLNQKVELLVEYKIDVGGIVVLEPGSDCSDPNPRYLFWQKDGVVHKQKFTHCQTYGEAHKEVVLENSELINAISNNLDLIERSEVLPVTSDRIEEVLITHDDYWTFTIHTKEEKFQKVISRFELETKYVKDEELNLNYKANQNSILKKVIDLAEEETN